MEIYNWRILILSELFLLLKYQNEIWGYDIKNMFGIAEQEVYDWRTVFVLSN